jgi:hypothetical protein
MIFCFGFPIFVQTHPGLCAGTICHETSSMPFDNILFKPIVRTFFAKPFSFWYPHAILFLSSIKKSCFCRFFCRETSMSLCRCGLYTPFVVLPNTCQAYAICRLSQSWTFILSSETECLIINLCFRSSILIHKFSPILREVFTEYLYKFCYPNLIIDYQTWVNYV